MGESGIRPAGTRLRGRVPQELVLSDGSRLVLGSATDEVRGRERLAGAGGAGNEHDRVAEEPAVGDLVEVVVAARDPLVAGVLRGAGSVARRPDPCRRCPLMVRRLVFVTQTIDADPTIVPAGPSGVWSSRRTCQNVTSSGSTMTTLSIRWRGAFAPFAVLAISLPAKVIQQSPRIDSHFRPTRLPLMRRLLPSLAIAAALSLGAPWFTAWRRVQLPLIMPGILATAAGSAPGQSPRLRRGRRLRGSSCSPESSLGATAGGCGS